MKKLDQSKPYGTVHGGDFAHRFEQGGAYFDGNGDETAAPSAQPQGQASAQLAGAATAVQLAGAGISTATAAMAMLAAATPLLAKGAEDAIAELEDQSDDMLNVLAGIEQAGKARKSVLAAIEALQAKRATPAGGDTVAGASQVDAQLGA